MYLSPLTPLANFDGIHYLDIARFGYITEAGFFPVYPLLIRIFGGSVWSALLISWASLILAMIMFRKLLRLDYSASISNRTIYFLFLFPTAFFFLSAYTESLFLFLLVAAFYAARKKRWLWAGLAGALLSATRLVGILVLPALLYEAWKSKTRPWSLALVPTGLLAYSWYCFSRFGDWFYFLRAHAQLGNSRSVDAIVLFPQTLWRYGKILTSLPWSQHEWQIALLELGAFFFGATLLYLGWRQKLHPSYQIFAWLAFLLPVSSGTFTGLPRYLLVIFPLFLSLALSKNRLAFWSYSILSGILLIWLFIWFYQGLFVA